MSDVDDMLEKESVKDLIDKTVADVDAIERLIIAYTVKEGGIRWRSNCRRSEGLGIIDIVHFDLLHLEWANKELDDDESEDPAEET